ncbi:MAG: VWA domain-containing protein [Treponema sp.]|jgi:Ca-activated chloride channel family protein|nr:VWA domain-containing protein [Treponema sp.]
MNIGFERPSWIALGVLAVPGILFLSRFFKSLLTLNISFTPPGGTPFKPPYNPLFLIRILKITELLGIFFLFVAAAGPHFITAETVWLNRGTDILFVLDISPSMAGIDMGNLNRFEAARNLVFNFVKNRPSDAVGLVAVGNDAALLLPPTVDRESLFSRLESLQIGELGDGSALGLGLSIAALHIGKSTAPRRAVVLITDGENNAGPIHPETAAEILGELGVSLWIIGLGSGGEIPINYVDPFTRIRRTGTFDSRFDPASLEAIARKGGGVYLAAPHGDAFSAAFSQIDLGEISVVRTAIRTRTRSFRSFFIIASLVLIGMVRFIRRQILGAVL